jgi:hypothetical protein
MNTQLTDGLSFVFQVTDINMPQLKQPMTLKDKSLQDCVHLYCGACERWISKLRQAQATGRLAYWNMTWSVLAECRQIERNLSEFPCFMIEMMSPQLTRNFAELIWGYSSDYRREYNGKFDNEETHKSVCIAMFRSVLTRYVYKYDTNMTWYSTIVPTLDSVPGLRILRFILSRGKHHPAQLSRMMCHLGHLQKFTYQYSCTDEVIEQLALHCSRLKELDLYRSSCVTNCSIQHLLQLRELEFLNLNVTEIDEKHYGMLLSELPQIKDISFRTKMGEDILDHVAEKDLHKISHVRGHVRNISMLAQRCRCITNLDIQVHSTHLDLSGLATLTTLRTVRISGEHYVTHNLNAVLTGIGPRLTDLTLKDIDSVNLQDIVTLCPLLASLSLLSCELLTLDPNTQLDPQLPHFRKLISLHILNLDDDETNYSLIRHYVSLKKIHLCLTCIFTVEFMREVVRSGTLAQLEEFYIEVYERVDLNMKALQMLKEHCSYLKSIKFWINRSIKPDFCQKLRLLFQNLDVDFDGKL